MAIQEVLVSKIFNYTSEPTKKVEGQFWFNPSTNVLSRYNGTVWKAITVSSDDVAVLSDGNKISLTNYLNTQIAALAEGIDSKQDKLLYYSETSGDTPSATISVANIKLTGKVAEGNNTTASGYSSHAEGNNTTASGNYSHAEGDGTGASGMASHAEGFETLASGYFSHAEGNNTTASGACSHAEGEGTIASSDYQHAQGQYNIEDANNKYADIIGNGSSASARSNAATVSWNGISWSQTDVRAGGTDQDSATYSLAALSEGVNNKQNKLNFYSEEGEGYLAEANISNTAHINFDAYDSDGGGSINIRSYSAAPVTSNITLEAGSNSSQTYSKIVLDSGTSDYSAFITIDGELTGSAISTSIPTSDAVDTKVVSEKAVATAISGKADKATTLAGYNIGDAYTKTEVNTELGKKQDKLTTYSESNSGVEISDLYINIGAGDVLTLLGQTSINLTTNNTPSSDIKLEAKDQSITLSSGNEGTEGSITVNGNITGSAISTSIPTSNAVDTKVTSEKAVKTELDKKQDKLLCYSEVSGETFSDATISATNIKLNGSVAEGDGTTASGSNSHAEGAWATASGSNSHAEGDSTKAQGVCSHTEGNNTTASGYSSHAEGNNTTASGNYSHAEGGNTKALSECSHAEGSNTNASGVDSHAEGWGTTASGDDSHAEGSGTIASSHHQHAQGKHNIEDANNKYADIIGNGTGASARSNAATVSWDGISWSQSDVSAGGVSDVYPMYAFSHLYNYLNKLYFIGSGGGLSFSTNPCANVLSRSYFFTFIVPEDWDTTSTIINANRTLNVIGDIYYSGGYQGFAVRIDNTGIMYGVAGSTSKNVYVLNNTPVGTLFNGSSPTIIPKGIYRCVATLTITDSNFSGKFFVNGQLVSSRSTTDLTTSNFVSGTIFAIGNSGNYNFFEFDQSKLGCNMCDIGVVNFDMSDESAPYTVSDYSTYCRPNPSLRNPSSDQRLVLELDNCTITQTDSTVIVNDISKNNCNATVVGNVSGDQYPAAQVLSAKQNATDNNLTTIDKTIVGAINGLNTRIDNSSGMLYFTGGSNKYGTGTFSAGEVFSVAYRTDFQFDYASASSGQYRPWSVGNPASSNISVHGLGDDRLRVLYNGGGFCGYKGSAIRSVIKPINDIVIIVTNPTGGNMNTSLYVNGVQIPQASYKAQPSIEMTGYRLNAMNYASSTIDTTMKDFAIFNFDMSAEGAPYSVADYLAGKPVPPSLKHNGGIFSSDPNIGASTSTGWAVNAPGGSSIVTSGAWRCFSAVYYCYNRTGDLPAGVEYAIDLSTKVSSEATGDAFLCNIGQGNFARFNGSRFKGRVSFWYRKNNTDTSASSILSVQIAKLIIASVSGADVSDNDWHFFSEEIDMTLTNIASGAFLGISSYASSGTFTDYPWSIADFKLESYTQEVGLENYTFTVGSTQYIPDASGNNHDITMSSAGIVAGTFDASIAKLASLIASSNA